METALILFIELGMFQTLSKIAKRAWCRVLFEIP